MVRKVTWMRWVSVSAACAVIVGMTIYILKKPHLQEVAIVQPQSPKPATVPGQLVIENKNERLKVCMLPDGSKVELSGDSKIRYTNPMEVDRRSIWLEGEAVFHVKKDPSKPFTVFTNSFATTALGTVFKVSSLKNKPETVLLISGRISVTNQNRNK